MDLKEKTIEKNTVYTGKVINMRSDRAVLPDGKKCVREFVEFPGGVCVVPVTEDGQILFVRQYRYPFSRETLEIPAGKLARGEEPLACAVRELKEETGARAGSMKSLGMMMPSPGYTNERIFMFLATELTYGDQQPDEDEFLELERIPAGDAVKKILNGDIQDAKTQLAVLKAYAVPGAAEKRASSD